MYQTPLVFTYLIYKLYSTNTFFTKILNCSYINLISYYYLDLNIWHFFKNILFKDQGVLINSISSSFSFHAVSDSINNLGPSTNESWTRLKVSNKTRYLKEIKVLPFALKKQTFNKITFLILFLLLQPFSSFRNGVNTTFSFLLISNNINLITFYSCFYFKVYNF